MNALSMYDWTPLMQATAYGHISVVTLLLEHGADVVLLTWASFWLILPTVLAPAKANVKNPLSLSPALPAAPHICGVTRSFLRPRLSHADKCLQSDVTSFPIHVFRTRSMRSGRLR